MGWDAQPAGNGALVEPATVGVRLRPFHPDEYAEVGDQEPVVSFLLSFLRVLPSFSGSG